MSFYFPEALQQSFLKNHASIFTPRHKKYFHQQKTPNSGQALDGEDDDAVIAQRFVVIERLAARQRVEAQEAEARRVGDIMAEMAGVFFAGVDRARPQVPAQPHHPPQGPRRR